MEVKLGIDRVHFFTQNYVFYKLMPFNLICNEKYKKVMLRKKDCGENLNVLTKSLSVETRNFTKSVSRKGGSSKIASVTPSP